MPPRPLRPALLVALAVAATLPACTQTDASAADTTTTTTTRSSEPARLTRTGSSYDVPSPLPTAPPGSVIAATRARSTDAFPSATRREVLYHSTDFAGNDVAVSGTLLVPDRTPPAGGWPVISWAHGTSGVADVCAPSTTDNLFYNEYAQQVRGFLAAGYAVAASDYVGLGTPGVHSYSIGVDLGNAVADIVAAARRLDSHLSSTWFAVGHSEGGQAVLFATRSAARHPDLRLAATVAIAPSSHLELALPYIAAGGLPADVAYGLYLLAGLGRVDPSVDITKLVGSGGRSVVDRVTTSDCLLDTLADLKDVPPTDVLALPADTMTSLSALLEKYGDPDHEPTVGPLLIVQGETDHDIPAAVTKLMADHLVALGSDATYREYPGMDHDRVLGPSMCETLAWMTEHGGPAATSCVAEPTDMS
ncbi:MAG: alpha/beta hydrolase [Acidimicrobiales bacterium]